ncbi:MAG: hypothetical protein IJ172_01550 [Ruminococcus sp.]|nr:hypothetical protein [Ruminococcus sp.]
MQQDIFTTVRDELLKRPKRLTDRQMWLFVVVNTARAMIDCTDKAALDGFAVFDSCESVGEVQYAFDTVQGRYGREGFRMRTSAVYNYLCSLVALFEQDGLTDADRALIRQFGEVDRYLLYAI